MNTYSYLFNGILLSCIYCVSGTKCLGFLQFFIVNIHSNNIRSTKRSRYLQTTEACNLVMIMLKSLIKQYHKFADVTVYLNFDKHINAVVKKVYPCCYLAIFGSHQLQVLLCGIHMQQWISRTL